MLIMPSFKKSLIVEQFQGNYLNADVLRGLCVAKRTSAWEAAP